MFSEAVQIADGWKSKKKASSILRTLLAFRGTADLDHRAMKAMTRPISISGTVASVPVGSD